MNNLLLLPEQYNLLWKSSWLSGLSSGYAFYEDQSVMGSVIGAVYLTSLNYWRYPTLSWRRAIDMGAVQMCLFYQIYKSTTYRYGNLWMFLTSMAITSFMRGCNDHRKGDYWKCTYNHMGLHIISNIANIALIFGERKYISE